MQLKRCPKCRETKPVEDFVRNRSTRDGIGAYCRPCHRRVVRENVHKNHGSGRDFQLKRRYGVDFQAAAGKILQQGGVCGLCKSGKPAHIDHDHRTGEFRGVLCFNCNRALGYFGDDLLTMHRAADYLESHS